MLLRIARSRPSVSTDKKVGGSLEVLTHHVVDVQERHLDHFLDRDRAFRSLGLVIDLLLGKGIEAQGWS